MPISRVSFHRYLCMIHNSCLSPSLNHSSSRFILEILFYASFNAFCYIFLCISSLFFTCSLLKNPLCIFFHLFLFVELSLHGHFIMKTGPLSTRFSLCILYFSFYPYHFRYVCPFLCFHLKIPLCHSFYTFLFFRILALCHFTYSLSEMSL